MIGGYRWFFKEFISTALLLHFEPATQNEDLPYFRNNNSVLPLKLDILVSFSIFIDDRVVLIFEIIYFDRFTPALRTLDSEWKSILLLK